MGAEGRGWGIPGGWVWVEVCVHDVHMSVPVSVVGGGIDCTYASVVRGGVVCTPATVVGGVVCTPATVVRGGVD